ncbi:protein kinase domain-containing protein [Aporhodopirellula aestuarii]|uniref:Protein kinase n=1 Tax=Aporhodopirellula aestuarii TaxID=2950107 RepID=A0ABT0U959_9BACT|nr:protein kinase [Aporhodopirellula aestuarii]MCM2373311.1 protein kinase [Aporhodopirellula aestuarii]
MSAATSRYRAGQEIVPGYTLVRRLGAGFSGQVWIARAAGGTQVALKVVELHKIGGRKELKALRTIRNVRHPNLCPVHSFWVRDSSGRLLRDDETETLDPDNESLETGPMRKPPSSLDPFDSPVLNSITETRPFDNLDESAENADKTNVAADDDSLIYNTIVTDSGASKGTPSPAPQQEAPPPPFHSRTDDPTHAEELIIVMGLGDGTLNDRLQEVRREHGLTKKSAAVCGLDAKEAIRYLRSSAQAIDALIEQHGILHGDIKPQNILLVGGEAQVCDFGLANKIEGDVRFTNQTFASPAYGAPEVLDGQTYSKTGDQYSLAVTYFELRTGLLPFSATTALKILTQKASESFDLQCLPSAQRKVLRKAMRSDPAKRYKTCVEFVDALAVAAGVDKVGGLNPVWVAIGGVVLAIAIAGGVAALLPSTGKSPQETYAEAAAEWQKYATPQTYSESRFTLRKCLDKLSEGILDVTDARQDQEYRSLATETSSALADEILEQLETPRFDDNGELLMGGLILEDVEVLQTKLGSDAAALVSQTSADGLRLQSALDLARLQLALLTGVSALQPNPEAMTRIRETLASELETPSEIVDPKATVSKAVAVALTHDTENADPGYFVEPSRLADVARAQNALQLNRTEEIAAWMMSKWNAMRDGRNGFLAQIEVAFREKSVGNETLKLIAATWPLISVEASIGQLKRFADDRDWPGFVKKQKALQGEVARSAIDDANLATQLAVFQAMSDGIISGIGLAAMEPVKSAIEVTESSWRPSMTVAVANWIDEIVTRSMEKAEVRTVSQAEPAYQTASLICEMVTGPIPEVLDRLVVATAMIEASPEAFENGQVNVSAERLSGAKRPLGMFYRSELSASKQRRLGRSEGGRLAQLLSEDDACSELPIELRSIIRDYHRMLADWHRGDTDAVLERISNLQTDSPNSRDVLGASRCRWIADTALQAAVDRLDVRRNDFFVADLPDAFEADLVDQIRWWLQPHGDPSPEMEETVELLNAHVALVKHGNVATLSPRLRERLEEMIASNQQASAAKPLSAEERLLARIAFEIARQVRKPGGSASQPADAKLNVESIRMMLAAASLMLDVDLGYRQPNQAWVRKVIAPTTHRVLSAVDRSNRSANGWTIPKGLNSQSLYRFSRHANRADAFTTLGEELARLSNEETGESVDAALRQLDAKEFFSAIAGDDAARTPADRFRSWIRASECFQDQLERREQQWTDANLRHFATYIKRAERLEPSSSLVSILKAFAIYHQARMRLASGQITHLDLEKTAAELGRAISQAENEPPSNAYFCVCWRHANLLVNLAFGQQVQQKYQTLLSARKSAIRATQMIGRLPATTQTNPAYLALGNACEDIAYYCTFLDDGQRAEYFQEAIANFSEAVGKTEWGQSLQPRYSLVRCRQRFVDSGLAGAEQYRIAMRDLGDLDTSAPLPSQIEWLGWSAQLHARLGERDDALRDAERAYGMVEEDRSAKVPVHQREETEYMYADILADSTDLADRGHALQLLSGPQKSDVPVTWWKAFVLRCRILDSIGEEERLAETVLAISVSRFGEQMRRDPNRVAQQIAEISFYLNRAGCPKSLGGPTRLDPKVATVCLKRLDAALTESLREIEADEAVRTYAAFVSANAATINEAQLSKRVKRYLDVLDSPGESQLDEKVRADAWRSLVRHFRPVFKPSQGFSGEARTQLIKEFPLLSTPDRERLLAALASFKSADTPPNEDEKYVITSIEQVLPQLKPPE